MPNTRTRQHDDSPPVTSKEADGERSVVASSVTINRPADEVYGFFRDFSQIAHFMENVEHIDVIDVTRSHWQVKGPAGSTVEWDAEVTEDIAGKSITWQSAPGADVDNSGRVTFADGGARGTIVTAIIAYAPPAGVVGKLIARIFQREPSMQTRRDLRRLKQLLETGEIATGARNPALAAAE